MKNLKEFKALILRYESVTDDQIKSSTGGAGETFGSAQTAINMKRATRLYWITSYL